MGIWIEKFGFKATTQLSNVCGASPINNQIIFFDGHDSHFDDHTPINMECCNIQTFVLKGGDSTNGQPNDNVPYSKLKSLYNDVNAVWILEYGTSKLLPCHMNSILVEAWETFKVSAGNIIREIFVKTNLLPSALPN